VGFARSTTHAATPFVKSMASRTRSRPQFDQSPAQNDNDSANQMDDDLLDKLHREFEAEQVQFDRDWYAQEEFGGSVDDQHNPFVGQLSLWIILLSRVVVVHL